MRGIFGGGFGASALFLFCVATVISIPAPTYASVRSNIPFNSMRLNNGLVGWWTFDGKDMTQNVKDVSGQGNNGHLVNYTATTTVNGMFGQAMTFNESNFVKTANSYLGASTTPFTVSLWANSALDTGGERWAFYSGEVADAGNWSIFIYQYQASWGFKTYFANGENNFSGPLTANAWAYLVITYDGTNLVAYKDGKSLGALTPTSPRQRADVNIGIGAAANGDAGFNGKIDDVRIYNRALSATEVAQFYRASSGARTGTTFSQPNLKSGLVGHWTFDGKDMAQNVKDVSGTGNTGYLTNFTSTTTSIGVIGQALEFSGGNWVKAGTTSLPTGASPRTMTAWVYSPTAGGQDTIFGYGTLSSNQSFGVQRNFGGAVFLWDYGTDFNTGYTMPSGQWVMLSNVYDGTNRKLYVNGTYVTQQAWTYATSVAAGQVMIGAEAGAHGFNGKIDDVRVYNRALSATELTQLYKLGEPVHVNKTSSQPNLKSGLVGHWTFDGKDMVSNVKDASGQGNDGALTNFTSTTTTQGVIGQALSFNGGSNVVNAGTGASLDNLGPMTVGAWIKPNSAGGGSLAKIVAKGNANTANTWQLFLSDGTACVGGGATLTRTFSLGVLGSDGTAYVYHCGANNALTFGTWQYVTATWGGLQNTSDIHLYVNGVEISYGDGGAGSNSRTSDAGNAVYIGNRADTTRGFDGTIDDVRLYNRALSAAEIKQLYNMGR